jgi:hypothetical protein
MQTLQYTRALRRIVEEMKVRELINLLAPLMVRPAAPNQSNVSIAQDVKERFFDLVFSSRTGYARLMDDASTAKVLESLNVGAIYATARLGRLTALLHGLPTMGTLWAAPDAIIDLFSFYDLLLSLSTFEKSCAELLEAEKLSPAGGAGNLLELQLIDYDGTGIEGTRLSQILSRIEQLHTDFARVLDVKSDRLRFIYFDSGTDFVAGILSAKPIVDGIRGLFREVWDRVKFQQFDDFDKKMGAISSGLTVASTIRQAVESKVITPEEGQLMKARILKEVGDLIGLGAALQTHKHEEHVDNRKLLIEKRDTKLLGGGNPPKSDDVPLS